MYTNLVIDEHNKYKTYLAEGFTILSLIMVMIGTNYIEDKLRRTTQEASDSQKIFMKTAEI